MTARFFSYLHWPFHTQTRVLVKGRKGGMELGPYRGLASDGMLPGPISQPEIDRLLYASELVTQASLIFGSRWIQ